MHEHGHDHGHGKATRKELFWSGVIIAAIILPLIGYESFRHHRAAKNGCHHTEEGVCCRVGKERKATRVYIDLEPGAYLIKEQDVPEGREYCFIRPGER